MIFHVIDLMYVAYVFIYQLLFVVYILAYKFDVLQIFISTVYRTRIIIPVKYLFEPRILIYCVSCPKMAKMICIFIRK